MPVSLGEKKKKLEVLDLVLKGKGCAVKDSASGLGKREKKRRRAHSAYLIYYLAQKKTRETKRDRGGNKRIQCAACAGKEGKKNILSPFPKTVREPRRTDKKSRSLSRYGKGGRVNAIHCLRRQEMGAASSRNWSRGTSGLNHREEKERNRRSLKNGVRKPDDSSFRKRGEKLKEEIAIRPEKRSGDDIRASSRLAERKSQSRHSVLNRPDLCPHTKGKKWRRALTALSEQRGEEGRGALDQPSPEKKE